MTSDNDCTSGHTSLHRKQAGLFKLLFWLLNMEWQHLWLIYHILDRIDSYYPSAKKLVFLIRELLRLPISLGGKIFGPLWYYADIKIFSLA